jgi:hypothetical protein
MQNNERSCIDWVKLLFMFFFLKRFVRKVSTWISAFFYNRVYVSFKIQFELMYT